MLKIGIFGGSFDPIHRIHVEIARAAMQQFDLSKVFVVPVKIPPHKKGVRLAADRDRMKMVELALSGEENILPSDIEIERKEVSYTSDTLALFKERFPREELFLIVGGDSVLYMEKWHRPDLIFKDAYILYAGRQGAGNEAIKAHIGNVLKKEFKDMRISELSFSESDVSATRIRTMIGEGKEELIKEDLDPKVYHYILERGLYQNVREAEKRGNL